MIVIKKLRPMFNHIVTTMDYYDDDVFTESGLIDTRKQKGTIKEYQKVLAVGNTVTSVKEGDLVCINPTRYAKVKHENGSLKDGVITDNIVVGYNFNVVDIDGKQCLILYDSDIRYVLEEWEEVPDPEPSKLIHPDNSVIL